MYDISDDDNGNVDEVKDSKHESNEELSTDKFSEVCA